jgi:predicted XRE-type DNA-binding protein
MKKRDVFVANDAAGIAEALGLSPADAIEIEMRSELNQQIIAIVKKAGLTHAEVAKLAGTSRTRMTAIMNRNTIGVSTDLLLRVVAALGYKARIKIVPAA